TTGVSAEDCARTVTALADPSTTTEDFLRPGHIFPLRYREGGVLKRAGHTEAAIDLARLAGLQPAGVLAELNNDDGTMMRMAELQQFAREHGLPLITVADLIAYRYRNERIVERVRESKVKTEHGTWTSHLYRSPLYPGEHLALVMGEVGPDEPVLTRVHRACVAGDVFQSQLCTCGAQLRASLRRITGAGQAGGGERRGRSLGRVAARGRLAPHTLAARMEGRASIVAGESVELNAPRRDEFVARWSLFNDPMLAMMLGSPVLAHGVHTRT